MSEAWPLHLKNDRQEGVTTIGGEMADSSDDSVRLTGGSEHRQECVNKNNNITFVVHEGYLWTRTRTKPQTTETSPSRASTPRQETSCQQPCESEMQSDIHESFMVPDYNNNNPTDTTYQSCVGSDGSIRVGNGSQTGQLLTPPSMGHSIDGMPPKLLWNASSSSNNNNSNCADESIQQGLDVAASFFGLPVNPLTSLLQTHTTHKGNTSAIADKSSIVTPSPTPSLTSRRIPFEEGKAIDHESYQNGIGSENWNIKATSQPIVSPIHTHQEDMQQVTTISTPPLTFIDPTDGNSWKAKYCVLQNRILYFYYSKTIAKSKEASLERNRLSTLPTTKDNNKKKQNNQPISIHLNDDSALSSSNRRMYQKRVALDLGASVRSAEHSYGPNTFELLGIHDDETLPPTSAIVLRAQDIFAMKEWIFQFHLSLTAYVRDLMEELQANDAYLQAYNKDSAQTDLSNSHLTRRQEPQPHKNEQLEHCNQIPHDHHINRHRHSPRNQTNPKSNSQTVPVNNNPPRPSASSDSVPERDHDLDNPSVLVLNDETPELSGPPKVNPETERPKPVKSRPYVPPHLRKDHSRNGPPQPAFYKPKQQPSKHIHSPRHHASSKHHPRDQVKQHPQQQSHASEQKLSVASSSTRPLNHPTTQNDHQTGCPIEDREDEIDIGFSQPIKLGGCADPTLVQGSILDSHYISRSASGLLKNPPAPFGSRGGSANCSWESGAFSNMGARSSNEDAYLIVHDLMKAVRTGSHEDTTPSDTYPTDKPMVLFAIFDGHGGNQTARYVTEKLVHFIRQELELLGSSQNKASIKGHDTIHLGNVEAILREALIKLDAEFCRFCRQDGRDWESGSTAIVTVLIDGWLVTGNLGDCQGLYSGLVGTDQRVVGWNNLENRNTESEQQRKCIWKELATVHNPSDDQEKERIEGANGWVTTEVDLDSGANGTLRRRLSQNYLNMQVDNGFKTPQRNNQITRVCGELAVSRALGDRDFKAEFNAVSISGREEVEDDDGRVVWECPLWLSYPLGHNRQFYGDLVANIPDFNRFKIGATGFSDEFLLLASDGLWDVLTIDDAIQVTRELLFQRKWSSKQTAARLAELAVQLGSLDNVTVIVVRLHAVVEEVIRDTELN